MAVERNQPDERAHFELVKAAIRIAEDVIEESILFIPQLIVAAAHVLHGAADVDEVLEELRGHRLVGTVLVRQLERDAHHVQAEESHPARRVGLFENGATGQPLAAIDHGDVVETEEAAFEDVQARLSTL